MRGGGGGGGGGGAGGGGGGGSALILSHTYGPCHRDISALFGQEIFPNVTGLHLDDSCFFMSNHKINDLGVSTAAEGKPTEGGGAGGR